MFDFELLEYSKKKVDKLELKLNRLTIYYLHSVCRAERLVILYVLSRYLLVHLRELKKYKKRIRRAYRNLKFIS